MSQRLTILRGRVRRALNKPPRELAYRVLREATAQADWYVAPARARRLRTPELLDALEAGTVDELWERLFARPYPALDPGERDRVLAAADDALTRRVSLLGSGPVELGTPIDWQRDFKSGFRWEETYARRIDYADLDRPNDVKVPWELSRLQWLLPAGQAYALTGDERYARGVREILDEWIAGNPYMRGVNWAIAMEPALRILSWTFLFHTCGSSDAWAEHGFRSRFLRALYLHADFVERHIERSDVNGNHLDADAAGLVFAGLFFGAGEAPRRWAELGWSLLVDELPRQVHPDGVDFEASTAYHRLVCELFALPMLYRERLGLSVAAAYRERLGRMVDFAAAYTKPDGSAPLWGDADDGRALPLDGSASNDHRHLARLVGRTPEEPGSGSAAFRDGGVFVLRSGSDHVFVDCGPVGLAGRGGHGHNDCLSFEAVLDGVPLVTDCGAYVYTASPEWRNRFRSTASHNTPRVDGAEQNRIPPDSLWLLADDAKPELLEFDAAGGRFRGSHTGYVRLRVRPIRTIELDADAHALRVRDELEGRGEHDVEIPFHLAPGVEARQESERTLALTAGGRRFVLEWDGDWECVLGEGWVSPSYGVKTRCVRIEFRRSGALAPLDVTIRPA